MTIRIGILSLCVAHMAMAEGEVYHRNNAAKAVQQHMVSVKEVVSSFLDTIERHYDSTGDWIDESDVETDSDAMSSFPIEIDYAAPGATEDTAQLLFIFKDESDAGEVAVNIPKALQGKAVLLSAQLSPNETTIERWTCVTNVDEAADLWDGYMPPSAGGTKLSRLASSLGGFYKDCKYDIHSAIESASNTNMDYITSIADPTA